MTAKADRRYAFCQMRERAGYKQIEVAEILEMEPRTYGSYEREEREINLADAIRVADLFGCTLDELAGRAPVKPSTITASEQHMLDVYRAASDHGRMLIDSVVSAEAQHMDSMAKGETRSA